MQRNLLASKGCTQRFSSFQTGDRFSSFIHPEKERGKWYGTMAEFSARSRISDFRILLPVAPP